MCGMARPVDVTGNSNLDHRRILPTLYGTRPLRSALPTITGTGKRHPGRTLGASLKMSPGLIPFINLSSIRRTSAVIILAVTACVASSARAADEPDLIFKRRRCSSGSPPMTSSRRTGSMTLILRAWLVTSPFRNAGESRVGSVSRRRSQTFRSRAGR